MIWNKSQFLSFDNGSKSYLKHSLKLEDHPLVSMHSWCCQEAWNCVMTRQENPLYCEFSLVNPIEKVSKISFPAVVAKWPKGLKIIQKLSCTWREMKFLLCCWIKHRVFRVCQFLYWCAKSFRISQFVSSDQSSSLMRQMG